MSTIKRTIKVRQLINPEGKPVKAILKWSNDSVLSERGASWYLVLEGKTYFPAKAEGVTSDELAKIWAGIFLRGLGYKFTK